MTEKTIELNRRRVLGGMITLGGAAAAAGAGTAAYFFDDTQTSDNTISAGELNIGDISEQTLDIGPLVPGNGDTVTITSDYTGDVSSPELDWGIVVANDTAGLADELELVEASLSVGGSLVNDYATESGVDYLSDLTGVYAAAATPSDGNDITFTLEFLLPGGASNALQGGSLDFGFGLKARQSAEAALELADISAT